MKIGDVIENSRHGVNGTNIPVGAIVQYATGVDQKVLNWTVVEVPNIGRMLCLGDKPATNGPANCSPGNCIHGQNSPMKIVSLPEGYKG